jgi:hypothetical protein
VVKERSLCAEHYTEWRKSNGLGLKVSYETLCDILENWDKDFTNLTCRVPNCQFQLRAKGLCRNHYQSWYKQTSTVNRRTAQLSHKERFAVQDKELNLLAQQNKDNQTDHCLAPECNNPIKYISLCYKHYKRLRRWIKTNNQEQAA